METGNTGVQSDFLQWLSSLLMRHIMLSILAILFDPLFLLMAMVAVSLGSNKNYIIPVTGVFIGVFAETLAMKVSPGHLWGDSFPTFMAAGIVQAIMAYFVVHWWKSRKHQAECGTQSDISGK